MAKNGRNTAKEEKARELREEKSRELREEKAIELKKEKASEMMTENRLAEFERRLQQLERRQRFLVGVFDAESDALPRLVRAFDLNQTQTGGINDALEHAYQKMRAQTPPDAQELIDSFLPHMPPSERDPASAREFVRCVLLAISQSPQWPDLPHYYHDELDVGSPHELT